MKQFTAPRIIVLFLALAALAAVLFAQRDFRTSDAIATGMALPPGGFEVRSLLPREISPAMYQQVSQLEISLLSQQGWELVSVMPYVYKNEERGPELHGPKPMVTQTYPGYFFKRARTTGRRE